MMQRRKKSMAVLLACALAAPLYAQASNIYLGLGGGRADNRDLDETDTAIKALAGFNFNETFGIEGSYVDFGEATRGAIATEAETVALQGVINLPFTPKFGAFAKGGVHYADVTTTVGAVSASGNETDATYGAGAKFDFTHYLGVRGEWERFEIDGADHDLISASLIFKFQ